MGKAPLILLCCWGGVSGCLFTSIVSTPQALPLSESVLPLIPNLDLNEPHSFSLWVRPLGDLDLGVVVMRVKARQIFSIRVKAKTEKGEGLRVIVGLEGVLSSLSLPPSSNRTSWIFVAVGFGNAEVVTLAKVFDGRAWPASRGKLSRSLQSEMGPQMFWIGGGEAEIGDFRYQLTPESTSLELLSLFSAPAGGMLAWGVEGLRGSFGWKGFVRSPTVLLSLESIQLTGEIELIQLSSTTISLTLSAVQSDLGTIYLIARLRGRGTFEEFISPPCLNDNEQRTIGFSFAHVEGSHGRWALVCGDKLFVSNEFRAPSGLDLSGLQLTVLKKTHPRIGYMRIAPLGVFVFDSAFILGLSYNDKQRVIPQRYRQQSGRRSITSLESQQSRSFQFQDLQSRPFPDFRNQFPREYPTHPFIDFTLLPTQAPHDSARQPLTNFPSPAFKLSSSYPTQLLTRQPLTTSTSPGFSEYSLSRGTLPGCNPGCRLHTSSKENCLPCLTGPLYLIPSNCLSGPDCSHCLSPDCPSPPLFAATTASALGLISVICLCLSVLVPFLAAIRWLVGHPLCLTTVKLAAVNSAFIASQPLLLFIDLPISPELRLYLDQLYRSAFSTLSLSSTAGPPPPENFLCAAALPLSVLVAFVAAVAIFTIVCGRQPSTLGIASSICFGLVGFIEPQIFLFHAFDASSPRLSVLDWVSFSTNVGLISGYFLYLYFCPCSSAYRPGVLHRFLDIFRGSARLLVCWSLPYFATRPEVQMSVWLLSCSGVVCVVGGLRPWRLALSSILEIAQQTTLLAVGGLAIIRPTQNSSAFAPIGLVSTTVISSAYLIFVLIDEIGNAGLSPVEHSKFSRNEKNSQFKVTYRNSTRWDNTHQDYRQPHPPNTQL